jgi:hypothetical protein
MFKIETIEFIDAVLVTTVMVLPNTKTAKVEVVLHPSDDENDYYVYSVSADGIPIKPDTWIFNKAIENKAMFVAELK